VQVSKSKILSLLTDLLSTFPLDKKEATSEFVKTALALINDPDPDGSWLYMAMSAHQVKRERTHSFFRLKTNNHLNGYPSRASAWKEWLVQVLAVQIEYGPAHQILDIIIETNHDREKNIKLKTTHLQLRPNVRATAACTSCEHEFVAGIGCAERRENPKAIAIELHLMHKISAAGERRRRRRELLLTE